MTATAPLPGVLAEIAEVAGVDVAIAVSLAYGGDWLHIPKPDYLARHPAHELVTSLGDEAARSVAARIGGGSIYIPMARRACACHLAREGVPVRAIAGRLGMSPTAVRRYVRSA